MADFESIFEEYQKNMYDVEHKVDMGFEAGFKALKYQIIPSILESEMFTDEEKMRMIEKYTHDLLNRTCKDWVKGEHATSNSR